MAIAGHLAATEPEHDVVVIVGTVQRGGDFTADHEIALRWARPEAALIRRGITLPLARSAPEVPLIWRET